MRKAKNVLIVSALVSAVALAGCDIEPLDDASMAASPVVTSHG